MNLNYVQVKVWFQDEDGEIKKVNTTLGWVFKHIDKVVNIELK